MKVDAWATWLPVSGRGGLGQTVVWVSRELMHAVDALNAACTAAKQKLGVENERKICGRVVEVVPSYCGTATKPSVVFS